MDSFIPIIHGKKVTLRRKTEKDLQTLWTYIYGTMNPEWKKWDAPYFPLKHLDFQTYRKQSLPLLTAIYPHRMVIEVDGKVIGTVSYYWEDELSKWLEAGIVIFDSDYWNGGYGTEALALWIDYLFLTLPIVRAGITTWSGNTRMMRTAEKIGMMVEGRMRKCRYYNGQYYDSIRMGILKEEWEQEKQHPQSTVYHLFH
ncbi:GNAT family N-acetyltransferase [Bacillus aquiflavi]|uniref:GNAT family N-acetyltransferase n=1 Tax=Bacillus aquiflavi TaxID=2672567 RepID=UPI001CA8F640|nr:GNAT family protein [Bacillus aquiflavi]UAC48464.1 GNAT family N-acetyltransferase [Bacillus aquiflavi]